MYRLLRNHVLFDADKGGGGGDPDKKPEEGKEPDAQGKGGLSQDELNKQFAERATRAAEAERKKLFESLGVKDEAEFEAYLKAKKEAEDKNKSDIEKAAGEAKKWQDAHSKLDAESKSTIEALNKRLVDTEIKIAALAPATDKDGKVIRAAFRTQAMDEVLLLIERGEIKEDDGKLTGVEKALDKLAKAKPYLLADGQQTKAPKGTPPEKTKQSNNQGGDERRRIISGL